MSTPIITARIFNLKEGQLGEEAQLLLEAIELIEANREHSLVTIMEYLKSVIKKQESNLVKAPSQDVDSLLENLLFLKKLAEFIDKNFEEEIFAHNEKELIKKVIRRKYSG